MFDLTNKVAIVTGARRGMGKAFALALAKQGAKVVVTDIDLNECQLVVDEIKKDNIESICFKMDVSKKEEVERVFDEVVKTFGRIDILVNNAGIYNPKPALEISEDEWQETIQVNLKGQFLCAQKAAREMIKNKWGRIINISSIASGQTGIGIAGGAHYTASKGGILGLTETLAVEWAEYSVTVNTIAPGAIDTPMVNASKMSDEEFKSMIDAIPLKRMGRPEEVAAAVIFLSSDESSYITGSTLYIDGGWLAG